MAQLTDANKEKKGQAEALALAKLMKKIVVAKGKKVVTLELSDEPDDATLLAHLLGPTGNLRAPTLQVGTTLYVGYNEAVYEQLVL